MKRDLRIDTIKGILIVCVVLGHVIGNFDASYLSQRVYDFIYMFHMPLFIFISGIFTHKRIHSLDFSKVLHRSCWYFSFFTAFTCREC